MVGSQPPPACCHASHILLYDIEDCSRGSFGRTINPFNLHILTLVGEYAAVVLTIHSTLTILSKSAMAGCPRRLAQDARCEDTDR